jgi:predicted porin
MDQAAKKLRDISASAMAAGISSTQSPAAAVAAAAVYAANDAGKQVVKNVRFDQQKYSASGRS